MSHPAGTYLGGIRSLEDMRQRCRIDDCTGCWVWGLSIVSGAPKVHFVTPDRGTRTAMRGRRAAVYLRDGRPLQKGLVAFPTDKCQLETCVNPAHTAIGTRQEMGAYLRRAGKSSSPAKAASARKLARKYRAKITMEDAREIRQSEESTYALAARYGIAQSAISSIKRGTAWKETMTQASVFSLGAA